MAEERGRTDKVEVFGLAGDYLGAIILGSDLGQLCVGITTKGFVLGRSEHFAPVAILESMVLRDIIIALAKEKAPSLRSPFGFSMFIPPVEYATEEDSFWVTSEFPYRPLREMEFRWQGPSREELRSLAKRLQEQQGESRIQALWKLRHFRSATAVPLLTRMVGDRDARLRMTALGGLGEIGPQAVAAVETIRSALMDKDVYVREAAARALADIGPDSFVAVPSLICTLDDPNGYVRMEAARALGSVRGAEAGAAVDALMHVGERDLFPGARRAAIRAIGRVGSGPRVAKWLLRIDQDDRAPWYVRVEALEALGRMRPYNRIVGQALFRGDLRAKKAAIRAAAVRAVGYLGQHGEPACDALCAIVTGTHETWYIRREACIALGRIGGGSPENVKAIVGVLQDESEHAVMRMASARALGGMGMAAVAGVPALKKSLASRNTGVQREAVLALGRMGPAADAAADGIAQLLRDESVRCEPLKKACISSLVRIQPGKATEHLITGLYIPETSIQCARAIQRLRHPSRKLALALTDFLRAPPELKALPDVALALGAMREEARVGVAVLESAVKDSTWPALQLAAVEALGEIGPAARAAIPTLRDLMKKGDDSLKRAIRTTLEKLGE